MRRKIIIKRCKDCPYVESHYEIVKGIGYKDIYYCNHDMNGNAPEKIKVNTIPDWCQLDKEGE